MEFDPDLFDPDLSDEKYIKEFCNVENENLPEIDESGSMLDNTAKLGLALGFGDFISNERFKEINRKNVSAPITFTSVHSYKKQKQSRPFDKFIDNLCKGKISIDDENY
ncbi:MAG: hypothetical protein U9Q27_03395 [Patescibacteria group bacterium]|nr:hypothetical protein [Patescibacteria group bacterium]